MKVDSITACWPVIKPSALRYNQISFSYSDYSSVTAGSGQHHGTSVCFPCCNVSCLNNAIRRKEKLEFDKTSDVVPLNWKRLRPVKIPCGSVEQNGCVRKKEDSVIQSRTRYHWLRWHVFESRTIYSANIRSEENSMKWKLYCSTEELMPNEDIGTKHRVWFQKKSL